MIELLMLPIVWLAVHPRVIAAWTLMILAIAFVRGTWRMWREGR